MKIYLDNCCYGRPYDDQTQLRINLESQAKLAIQHSITLGKFDLVSSLFIVYENGKKKNRMVKEQVSAFIMSNSKEYVGRDAIPAMMGDISAIESEGVKPLDASHVAAAIHSGCDYFITTDDRILRYRSDKIRIVDPVQFIKETEARE